MLNAYNIIANSYGLLASLMFGKSINKIQHKLIQQLPTEGTLLILGGGNGKILPLLYQHAPKLQIEYLEASSAMIELAIEQAPSSQDISFNHNSNFTTKHKAHDFIFCGFFFDQFTESEISQIIAKTGKEEVSWFVADFSLTEVTKFRLWRKLQIKLSILFFKLVAKHAVNYLPNVFETFQQNGYRSVYMNTLSNGFYRSQVFQR